MRSFSDLSPRALRWISALLPMGFMVGVLYWRLNYMASDRAAEGNLYALVAVALGAVVYSVTVFGLIERREEEIQMRNQQLDALHESALALTMELELQIVLQKVVDLSRELLHCKFGALGVLEADGPYIAQFIVSGLRDDEYARIGDPPRGHGLLGVIIQDGQPLIINDIRKDPRSAGFPLHHPPMHSLLGVPIKSKGEIFGNLYLADKIDPDFVEEEELINFDDGDRQLLEKFATQAAIAIENAQLYSKTQELAVLQERERFRMDLHDGIMQSVYATGLSLQEAEHSLDTQPDETRARIQQANSDLSQVLRDIRSYILGLRPDRFQGRDLSGGLEDMSRELHANTLINVAYEPSEDIPDLDDGITAELLHIAREAFTNIRKHALARNVTVRIQPNGSALILEIQDDGRGFDRTSIQGGAGNGVLNMNQRAKSIGAEFDLASSPQKGTRIRVTIPVNGKS